MVVRSSFASFRSAKEKSESCVAFCFLTRELPLQSELWYEFFLEGARKGLPHVVCVHNKEPVVSAASPEHAARHFFAARTVSRPVATEWGNVSLVRATLELWREAIAREPRVTHLCLLSEACAPVSGFERTWRSIARRARTTFDVRPPQESSDRWAHLRDQTLIAAKHRRKQSQWFVACRADADWFLATDFTDRWGDDPFAPDEHYFIALLAQHGRPYDDRKTTFNDWAWKPRFPHAAPGPVARQARPHVFGRVDAATLDALRRDGFLFLRKVRADTVVELDVDL